MHVAYLDAIKKFEGYTDKAFWDYSQQSNGYGTRALFPGEVISKAEAERRFTREVAQAAELVDRFASGLDTGTRAALTSLTYNAGTKWMNSGLGEAIRNGDFDTARERFLSYTKAGGEELPGLVKRRLEEASWFGKVADAPATIIPPKAHAQSVAGSTSSPTRWMASTDAGLFPDLVRQVSDGQVIGSVPQSLLLAGIYELLADVFGAVAPNERDYRATLQAKPPRVTSV